jgi:hypothetical protein
MAIPTPQSQAALTINQPQIPAVLRQLTPFTFPM